MVDNAREADTRLEYIDSAVKNTAKLEYKMKTLCTIDSSDAWTESYFQETSTTEATGGGTGSGVGGVPQMAPFPFIQPTFTKVSTTIKKYAAEYVLSIENLDSATIPMLTRCVLIIARSVSYAIDVAIESLLSASAGNTHTIAGGNEWDSATIANRDPIYDILSAINLLRADGYDALNGRGYLVLNGTDYTNFMSNSKVLNNPSFKMASDVQNGVVGEICGLKVMLSEAVTADQCYVVIGQEALTWKQATPLTTAQIEDAGKSVTIRSWERGVPQIPNPNAACKITNTRK